ncbi:hypothetical protein EXIGLDRAFT_781569 [Exidia glandulosa HHB12029]|uniref:Uncharacterized protein n=1 Tax=Exidia glandulosa HHB12029 TaxID=1314781 RepID=A0A165B762_EXIGL|nr:hypothetical protein EXIGLDRAFT_781569 [Exidia glandulosa HHB12029]
MLPLIIVSSLCLVGAVRADWTSILFMSNAWSLSGNVTRAPSAPGCPGGGLVANIFGTIELSFVGTAVVQYGPSPDGDMSVLIDGASRPSSYDRTGGSCGVIFGYSNLDPHARHIISISTVPQSSGPGERTEIIINSARGRATSFNLHIDFNCPENRHYPIFHIVSLQHHVCHYLSIFDLIGVLSDVDLHFHTHCYLFDTLFQLATP